MCCVHSFEEKPRANLELRNMQHQRNILALNSQEMT